MIASSVWTLVPVTVERVSASRAGAFVVDRRCDDGRRRAAEKKLAPPDVICSSGRLWSLRVFDQLIDNVDRNLATASFPRARASGASITRGRSGLARPRNTALPDSHRSRAAAAPEGARVPTLKREDRRSLNDADIRDLLSRRDALVPTSKLGGSATSTAAVQRPGARSSGAAGGIERASLGR